MFCYVLLCARSAINVVFGRDAKRTSCCFCKNLQRRLEMQGLDQREDVLRARVDGKKDRRGNDRGLEKERRQGEMQGRTQGRAKSAQYLYNQERCARKRGGYSYSAVGQGMGRLRDKERRRTGKRTRKGAGQGCKCHCETASAAERWCMGACTCM